MRNRTPFAFLASAGCALLLAAEAPAQQQPKPAGRPGVQTTTPPEEPRPGIIRRRTNEGGVARGVDEVDFTGTGRLITVGQQVRSELDASDPRADDDTYYEEWTFRGRPGTRIAINLGSGAFDSYLVWGRRVEDEFMGLAVDDDGGEDLDSRLTVWIRDGQEYVIRANTYGPRATGRYTLFVEEAAPRTDPAAPRGDIQPGQTRRGELGPGDALLPRGAYSEVWTFRGRSGQRVRITVTSDDFDTQVTWARLVGGEAISLAADDDGGEGTDSELTAEVAEGGYRIVVSAVGPGQAGAYTLRVEPASR